MAWNVFKFCTGLRALGSIMIVFVLAIIGVTYYAMVVAHYGPTLFLGGFERLTAIVVLFLFHFLLVMIIWSYSSVVLTDPGGVPPNWRPPRDEEKGDADPLLRSGYGIPEVGLNQSAVPGDYTNQDIRFCRKCNQFKPPRTHHCSVCNRCILKMDHHCVWVVNCVGALNYKFFLLFLFYTFLGTTLVSLSLLRVFMEFFSDGEIDETPGTLAASFITFVLNIAFALSVLGFLIMHVALVRANTTTIEAYEKKTTSKWRYDLGWKKNFEQARVYLITSLNEPLGNKTLKEILNVLCHVAARALKVFGADRKFWFIPAYSEDDLRRMPSLQGLEYPTRPDWEPPRQL